MPRTAIFLVALALLIPVAAFARQPLRPQQLDPDREEARVQSRLGWEYLRQEQLLEAVQAFERAIEIDPQYEYAYYGLGRAALARKQYRAAIATLERCRALYRAESGRQFVNEHELQRYRQDRMLEIDEQLRQARSLPPTFRTQNLIRELENHKRELTQRFERAVDVTIENYVPAFVTLSLGSAYFRDGRFADAEREYKATIAADPESGEAFNNLAVVYLETGRYAEADEAVRRARETGFRVNPLLEQAIKKRSGG